jgi:hypothetical protein
MMQMVQELSDADDARRAVIGDANLGKPVAITALDLADTARSAALHAIENIDLGIAQATALLDDARAAEAAALHAVNAALFKAIAQRRVAAAAKVEEAFSAVMDAIAAYDQLGADLVQTGLLSWAGHLEITDYGRIVYAIPERLQRIACANGAPIHPQPGITFAQREAMLWGVPPLNTEVGKAA